MFELINFLKIKTKISFSKDISSNKKKLEKIIEICKQKKANIYLSGPSASNYIDEEKMNVSNLSLEYIDYRNYMYEIKNKKHAFVDNLSVIDLLMNFGSTSNRFLK